MEIEGSGPSLLLLHGFTGSVRTWDDLRGDLSGAARVIAVDLIGHGRSEAPAEWSRYTLDHAAADLRALLDRLAVDSVDLLGYSMGGRLALQFAISFPERLRTLVLESASPGIEDAADRARRVQSDEALAERIERDGVAAFVEDWERQPLLALSPHVAEEVRARQHAQRLDNSPLGLANSLRGMGAGQQRPLWSRLAELTLSTSLIAGERDARYVDVAQRMQSRLPNATLDIVSDAGHTVHIDQPRRFGELVRKCIGNKLT